MTGVNGVFFRALAVTMCAALLTSLVLALTWTPTLSLYLLRRKNDTQEPEAAGHTDMDQEIRKLMAAEEASMKGFFRRVIDFYERWLRRALQHPRWLAIGALLLVAVSFICYKTLGSDLLPEMDEGGFILDYLTPPGSSFMGNHAIGSLQRASCWLRSRSFATKLWVLICCRRWMKAASFLTTSLLQEALCRKPIA